MRVLQINAVYYQGSTGTIVRDIEQLCWQSGIECYVASPDTRVCEAKKGYVIGNAIDHKLHAILCRIHGKQAYFSRIPTYNLCRYIDQIKPDIVHLHNLHSNYIHLNCLLKHLAKKGIKTVITLHDCWYFTGGCFHYTSTGCGKWLTDCSRCPKRKSDTPAFLGKSSAKILADRKKHLLSVPHLYIVGVSEWITGEAKKSFLKDKPIMVIHNGIDLNVFQSTPSDIRRYLGLENKYVILGPASKWLLNVNRSILNDFSKLLKSDEVLLLFGCKEVPQDLPQNVMLYGYLNSRQELVQLYSMADVMANVTREDSLSLINVEAQACGTPVVTFDQTGPKETVDGIHSFYVPVGDTTSLYKAVETVRQGNSENRNDALRQFINQHFELTATYQKYIDLYHSI